MVKQSKSSSDNQNQPNFFSETLSIFFITFTSMITIYLSLLSLSIFLKFCYFHGVGSNIEGQNLYPKLGISGIFIFSAMLIGPAIKGIGSMLGSGSPDFMGSISFIYLIFVIIRGFLSGHTIPKCLPAFPNLPIYLGGIKNWDQESIYKDDGPPRLNVSEVIDKNWTSNKNWLSFIPGTFNSLIMSNSEKELGMKNIGDTCLIDRDNSNCKFIKGKVDPYIFLGNKYVGKYMINEPPKSKA